MAKEKTKLEKAEAKGASLVGKFISTITNLLIVLMVGGAVYFIYKNPEIINDYFKNIKEEAPVAAQAQDPEYAAVLMSKLDDLSNKLAAQNAGFASPEEIATLNQKYEALEKTNLTIIDSKADAAQVLLMMSRMDRLEEKVSEIAKISDRGALVLSAMMLVKERADRGDKFSYEAEILSELASGESKIKQPVEEIVKLSYEGVPSNQEIVSAFLAEYAVLNARASVEELPWFERVKAKLRELVQVRKIGDKLEEDQARLKLEAVREQVEAYRFARALELSGEAETNWAKLAQNRLLFDRAVSQISAYSLAVMKVNALKGQE